MFESTNSGRSKEASKGVELKGEKMGRRNATAWRTTRSSGRRKWQGTKNWDLEGRGIPANSFCPRGGLEGRLGERIVRPAGQAVWHNQFGAAGKDAAPLLPTLVPASSSLRGTHNRPCLTTAMHHDRSLPLANLCSPLFLFFSPLCSGGGGVQRNWCTDEWFRTRQGRM